MRQILYVDLDSPVGHGDLHKSHLSVLSKINGFNTTCVFKKKYVLEKGIRTEFDIIELPLFLYLKKDSSPFINRLFMFFRLLYFKLFINVNKYDIVFFSSYDEIVFFFSFILKKVYLLNNSNISGLSSFIKRFCFKYISKFHTQIVFENYIKDYLVNDIKIKNVLVLKHGILPPKIINENTNFNNFEPILVNIIKSKFIFFPSSTSSDDTFFKELLANNELDSFLENNNIWIVARTKPNLKYFKKKYFFFIDKHLSNEEYNMLFVKSCLIVLNYPKTFKYKVSNVFFECVANNKFCVMSEIEAFKVYKQYINDPFYFSDVKSFIDCLKSIDFSSVYNKTHYNNISNFYVDLQCLKYRLESVTNNT